MSGSSSGGNGGSRDCAHPLTAFCAALPAIPGRAFTAELTHARVGGPPADWNNVEVCYDGKWSGEWIEVDAKEGWGIRFAKDAGDDAKRETMMGAFSLCYK